MPRALIGDRGERWGFFVKRKRRALDRWRNHLAQGRCAGKVIYWSGITDPYATPADETRGVWSALLDVPQARRPRRMIVQTRFAPDRDADLMARYAAQTPSSDDGPPIVVSYSIGTDRNDLIAAWERATPSFERRMKTVETLCRHSLFVVVTLSPFALWNDLAGTLRRLDDLGVPYVTVLFLKEGGHGARTPRPFLEFIRKTHPQLLNSQWQAERLIEIQSVLGPHRVIVGKEGFASLARPHLNPTSSS
jgi:DNA repair photolyase